MPQLTVGHADSFRPKQLARFFAATLDIVRNVLGSFEVSIGWTLARCCERRRWSRCPPSRAAKRHSHEWYCRIGHLMPSRRGPRATPGM